QKRPTASTHDLAPVVDAKRHARGSPEGSEIAHPVRGGPEECMRLPGARFRKAGDLAAVVHVMRDARRSAEAPQVEHPPRLRPKPSRLVPTTWPCPLTALAWLTAPPSVPRSWIETSVTTAASALRDAFRPRACARAASWPTSLPPRRSRPSVPRTAAPGWRGARSG